MVRKKNGTAIKENELYVLPSPNEEMRSFVSKFKIDMMEHIVSSVKFALDNNLDIVEIFQFKNSPFVVTLSLKEFASNMEHIHKFYMDNEIYELCPQVEKLIKIIKKKNNEKEKSETDGDGIDDQ